MPREQDDACPNGNEMEPRMPPLPACTELGFTRVRLQISDRSRKHPTSVERSTREARRVRGTLHAPCSPTAPHPHPLPSERAFTPVFDGLCGERERAACAANIAFPA